MVKRSRSNEGLKYRKHISKPYAVYIIILVLIVSGLAASRVFTHTGAVTSFSSCGGDIAFSDDFVMTQDIFSNGPYCYHIMNTANVTFDCAGYQIFSNSSNKAFLIENSANVTIKNCRLGYFPSPVWVSGTNSSFFYNNSIYNTSQEAVRITTSSMNNQVYNNTVYNAHSGIDVDDGSSNNLVTNNVIINGSSGGNSAIILGIGSNNMIIGNNIVNSSGFMGGIMVFGPSNANIISFNNISGTSTYGISLANTAMNNVIQNNRVQNSTTGILVTYNSSNNTIINNVVDGCSFSGVSVSDVPGVFPANNILNNVSRNNITNNYIGIYVLNSTNNTYENNNIVGSTNMAFYNNQSYNANASRNYWGTTSCPTISQKIFDFSDNSSLGVVTFEPFLDNYYGMSPGHMSCGAAATPIIYFTNPTPANNTNITGTSFVVNISINQTSNIDNFILNWNGTNYTYYDDSLKLMFNFDNVAALGESSTKATDVSKYGNNGTINGATWTSGKYGNALSFNGNNNYVDAGSGTSLDFGNNGRFTISAWIKPAALKNYAGIVSKVISTRGGVYTFLTGFYVSGQLGVYSPASSWKYTSGAISAGNWYHVAYAYDGANVYYYVNGVPFGSSPFSYTDDATHNVFVGSWYTGGTYDFNGVIDEVRVYNRTLSADEINRQYYSNLYKYDTDRWQFYKNQTVSASGSYYSGFVNNTSGSSGITDIRFVNPPPAPFGCGSTITQNTTLTADTTSSGTCITIRTDNITLDCGSHVITGPGSGSVANGIVLRARNVTIKNCAVKNFNTGIYMSCFDDPAIGICFYSASNNTLMNNSLYNNYNGIYLLSYSVNNTVINNSAYGNTQYGIYMQTSSSNNLINNTANLNGQTGIYLDSSSSNSIINRTTSCTNSNSDIYNVGSGNAGYNNTCDISVGWNDIGYTGCRNSCPSPPLSCGSTITRNTNLTADLTSSGITCITIGVDNIVLDCAGHSIIGSNNIGTTGILSTSRNNVTIKNCKISNFGSGIKLDSSQTSKIINNTATANVLVGIYLYSSSNNNVTNNTANSNSYAGINLQSSSINNNIANNVVYSNNHGIFLDGSSSNIIASNAASSNGYAGISLQSSSNNIMTNNTVVSSNYGIYLSSSSSNRINNNTAYSNYQYGVYSYSSPNNNISSNTVNSNSYGIYIKSSSNSNLTSNVANSNIYNGIDLESSPNSNAINNTANANNGGIVFVYGSNNNITNNTANSNSEGIVLGLSSNNNVINNTANTNSQHGIFLSGSSNNNINNNRANFNAQGIVLYASSNNNILANNTANSNILEGIWLSSSLNNTHTGDSVYKNSRRGIYLDSSADSNVFINVSACYDTSNDVNNNNFASNTFTNTTCNQAMTYGATCSNACPVPVYVSSCGVITAPGYYMLSQNLISGSGTCMLINNTNGVTLECLGYSITGSGTGYGVHINHSTSVDVRNCVISNFADAIHVNPSSDVFLANNTLTDSGIGAHLLDTNSSSLTRNIVYNNTVGVQLDNSLSNYISANTIFNNTYGFNSTTDNTLRNNFFYENGLYCMDSTCDSDVSSAGGIDNSVIDVSNRVIEKPQKGRIRWKNPINISGRNLGTSVSIETNKIYVDATNLPSADMNTSATITLNILSEPTVIYYFPNTFLPLVPTNDTQTCPTIICQNISYDTAIQALIFDVTHFSGFMAGFCGDNACVGETCSSCSADCGACPSVPPTTPSGGGGGYTLCTANWSCGEWSECYTNGTQGRACNDVGTCHYASRAETRNCTPIITEGNIQTCYDNAKNQDETDVDCGGAICGSCENNKRCLISLDCMSEKCANNVCIITAGCYDHIWNGDETDVDCGGSCKPCSVGSVCRTSSDCENYLCSDGRCVITEKPAAPFMQPAGISQQSELQFMLYIAIIVIAIIVVIILIEPKNGVVVKIKKYHRRISKEEPEKTKKKARKK